MKRIVIIIILVCSLTEVVFRLGRIWGINDYTFGFILGSTTMAWSCFCIIWHYGRKDAKDGEGPQNN